MEFNDFLWHDAIVKSISIDRNNPGIKDVIKLEIQWLDGEVVDFVFTDVYFAQLSLNFGIVTTETILTAESCGENDPDLVNLYNKWKGHLSNVNLNTYIFKFNSTASVIKIIAGGFTTSAANPH